jgi:hypothetical protein
MHDPRESHLAALKGLLCYVKGTFDFGLVLHRSSSTELVLYTDADWAGYPDTHRSTSGYVVFLGGYLVTWSPKRQPAISRSSAEVEYRAVPNAVAEAAWLKQLLGELRSPLTKSTLITATMSAPCTSPPRCSCVEPIVYHLPVIHQDPQHTHPMMTRQAAGSFGR